MNNINGMTLPYTPARWMRFVDGENLTISALRFLKSRNLQLSESARYRRNCFFWPGDDSLAFVAPGVSEPRPVRSFFYTSKVGDEPSLTDTRTELWKLGFRPHVFKKDGQSQKTKGVDIALTKDMLSHAFRNNYEVAQLIAGDGDYVPLVEEVKRLGKRVQVCFVRPDTNQALILASDSYWDATGTVLAFASDKGNATHTAPNES